MITSLLLSHGYRISGVEQDLFIKTDGAGTIRFKLHVDDGAGWSNSRTLHKELCSVLKEVWPNLKWQIDEDSPMGFSISRERRSNQSVAGSDTVNMHSMESNQEGPTYVHVHVVRRMVPRTGVTDDYNLRGAMRWQREKRGHQILRREAEESDDALCGD